VPASPLPLVCTLASLADVLACTHEATEFARGLGFAERGAWEVGIAASELATNAMRHAGGGSLTVRAVETPASGIELLAEDRGPGIADVESAISDDYSQGRRLTANVAPAERQSLGSGLGAVKRLTDELAIESTPGEGTTVRAFKRLPERGSARRGAAAHIPPAENPVLVLGLGNAILCDDGVGVKVARYIAEQFETSALVVREAEVAGFALLDLLEGFDRAVVVDAVRLEDGQPGDIVVFALDALAPSLHLVAGHEIDLPTALEMGRQLGRHVPRTVHVVGIGIADDRTFCEECTPAVTAAIPAAARIAVRLASARP
jgi:hydrogenase maturation protease